MNKSELPQPLPADADGGIRLGVAIFFNVALHWTLALGFLLLAWLLDQSAWLILVGWLLRSALVQVQPRTSYFTRYLESARRAQTESN
jgi:hypothetical protein